MPHAGVVRSLAAVLFSLSLAASARAEAPPDVVLRNDGGMLRGTIIELVPGDFVVLQLPDGTSRRVPMSEVKYAGPAGGAPGAAAPLTEPPPPASSSASPRPAAPSGQGGAEAPRPMVTVHAEKARLSLRSSQAGITFHRQSTSATSGDVAAEGYDVMCVAPCEVTMGAGTHTFALSQAEGDPVRAEPVNVERSGELRGEYTDNSGTRIAGWITLGVGQAAGYGLLFGGLETESTPMAVVGGVFLLGGIVTGLVLGGVGDEASLTFVPGPVAATPPARALALGDPRADAASSAGFLGAAAWGGSLVGRF